MKFLFVGMGSIGQRHVRNLRKILGYECEIIAYRMRNQDIVLNENMQVEPDASIATRYNIQEFYNYQSALNERPDAVFITNPSSMHIPTAIEAAKAGCHLFIEKPLSDSDQGLTDLIKLVKSQNLVTLIGYQQRFHPGMQKTHEWFIKRRIGNLISARFEYGEYMPNWHPYEDYHSTYGACSSLGGGALLTLSHAIDSALWFLGKPQRLFASGGHLSHLKIDVEDIACILMSYDIGTETLPVFIHLDYLQCPVVNGFSIIGDRGRINWDFSKSIAELITKNEADYDKWEDSEYSRNNMFISELRHFLSCIKGEDTSLIPLEEAEKTLQIALLAKQSMKNKKAIEL